MHTGWNIFNKCWHVGNVKSDGIDVIPRAVKNIAIGEPWKKNFFFFGKIDFLFKYIPNAKKYAIGNFNFSYWIDEWIFLFKILSLISDVWLLRISYRITEPNI